MTHVDSAACAHVTRATIVRLLQVTNGNEASYNYARVGRKFSLDDDTLSELASSTLHVGICRVECISGVRLVCTSSVAISDGRRSTQLLDCSCR